MMKTGYCAVKSVSGKCFFSLLFPLYTMELFSILENKLYGYADDSTLVAVIVPELQS